MEGDPSIMVNIRFLRVSILLTAEAASNFQSRRVRPTDEPQERKLPGPTRVRHGQDPAEGTPFMKPGDSSRYGQLVTPATPRAFLRASSEAACTSRWASCPIFEREG